MARKRADTNRIEVDLKLLQDKNLAMLKDFGDKFSKSIDDLKVALGDQASRMEGAAARISRPGGGGSPSEAPVPPPRTRQGGSGNFFGNQGGGGGPAGQASTPDNKGSRWSLANQSYAEGNISEFEKSQFNLGNIGGMDFPAQMRYLSHIAGRGGWEKVKDENGNDLWKRKDTLGGHIIQRVSGALGVPGRVAPYLRSAQGLAAQMYNYNTAPTVFGQNLGLSRGGGIFGTSIGSAAWRSGVMANLHAGERSLFGLSSNYSMAQAKEAAATINNYGYGGDLANRMADLMKDVTVNKGIDAATQMQLLDPAMRFGTDSFQGVVDTLYELPQAARAARMGLQQFTQDLMSSAQELSQSTGMTMGGATRALSSFSASTGLAPSKGAPMLSNETNMYMTMGLTGRNMFDLTYGPHAGTYRTDTAIGQAERVFGMPMNQWHALKLSDPHEYSKRMSNLMMNMGRMPELYGNLNSKDLISMSEHPHRRAYQFVGETLGASGGHYNWNKIMSEMGVSQQVRAHFWANHNKNLEGHMEGRNLIHLTSAEVRSKDKKYLQNVLSQLEDTGNQRARRRVMIDLSPGGYRLLRVMDKTFPKQTSNSGGDGRSYAASANDQSYLSSDQTGSRGDRPKSIYH